MRELPADTPKSNREWTRIGTNDCSLFAFIRVHSRLILHTSLQVLGSRQHHQVADGHVGWAGQHKQNCFGDVFRAQPFA
jgi:hypothetical protein